MKLGLSLDRFVDKLNAVVMVKLDIFETVAKFRALRKMHAKITRVRFGYEHARCLGIWSFSSGGELTAQQPLNNIARTTIQGLGAVLAGARRNHICPYDEPLWIPSEHAATTVVRIQQILFHETFATSVIDPLGGSYYVEWLTSEIEKRTWELLDQIEEKGGFIKCLENGYFKAYAESNAYQEYEEQNTGKRVRVGVNKYVEPDEKITIPDFKIDPEYEGRRIKELTEFKQSRDNNKVQQALNELSLKLRNGNGTELVPALIEAARADATLGEMCEVMRREHGWIKIT
jgi:methylmalonyl-CoA mutase N-terminal domain/subunit